MVIESLERLIRNCAARHESLVCEGVHLSLNFVVQLMQRNPTVVPFLIYISNEEKHKERFAVSLVSSNETADRDACCVMQMYLLGSHVVTTGPLWFLIGLKEKKRKETLNPKPFFSFLF